MSCVDLRETDLCPFILENLSTVLNEGRSLFIFTTAEKLHQHTTFHNFCIERVEPKIIVYDEAHANPTWGVEFRNLKNFV